jgi:hypothetical protein
MVKYVASQYWLKIRSVNTVTCQPIVALLNRGYATRFQAPAGKQDFRADAMTSRDSIGIRFLRNMPRWHHTATGVGESHVTVAFPRVTQHSSHLARCCSDACTIEGFIRGTGMSLLSSCSTSEVSIGDRHGKCENVKCVIIWDSNW